jgi:hypothetical protein
VIWRSRTILTFTSVLSKVCVSGTSILVHYQEGGTLCPAAVESPGRPKIIKAEIMGWGDVDSGKASVDQWGGTQAMHSSSAEQATGPQPQPPLVKPDTAPDQSKYGSIPEYLETRCKY